MKKKPIRKTLTLAQWRKLHPRADTVGFSVQGVTYGGMSYATGKMLLEHAGIPHAKSYTPYVGHWAVDVPKKFERQAHKILL